jgi:parallel beta-helix repeat protein
LALRKLKKSVESGDEILKEKIDSVKIIKKKAMKSIYKRLLKRALLATLIIHLSLLGIAANYYVSNSGNDTNTGLTTTQAWKTLTKVNSSAFKPGDQILFERGSSFYGTLTIKYSGTSGNPITYGAYGTGANPKITGFTQVTSWTNLGSNIWESTNAVSTLPNLNIVTINGINTAMGRTPNSGSVYTAQTHNANISITSNNLNGTPNWTGAQVVIRKNAWTWQVGTVTNQSGGTISFSDEGTFTPTDNCGFFFQADSRTLDIQNEWYYNPTTKKIRVYSTSQPVNVAIPTVDILSDNYGKNYININGLTFQGANSMALKFNACSNIYISNCVVNKIGLEGIYFYNTSTFVVNNNTIKNCNYSAVFSYAGTKNTNETITNNNIDSTYMILGIGRLYQSAAIHTNTDVSLVQYNTIQHSGYDGIMHTGLTGQVRNNFINYSLLNRSDGGGIYTTVATTNLVIDGNIILNSMGYPLGEQYGYVGARGIYLDSNSANITVSNNTVAYCWDGIYLNSGSNHNTISDNTTYNNTRGALAINNLTQASGSINNNVVINNKFVAKSINTGIQWYNDQMVLWCASKYDDITTFISSASGNCYARPLADTYSIKLSQPNIGNVSKKLEEWVAFSGKDINSQKSPQSISSESDLQFEYNAGNTTKSVSLPYPMIDVKGTKYVGTVTLQPYTSVVLMKDANPDLGDVIAPVITGFSIPSTSTSLIVAVSSINATDNVGVTGYLLSETSTKPISTATGWLLTKPTSYTFSSIGTKSLYVWAKDAAGNVSASLKADVIISDPAATAFTLTGPSSGNVNSASANFTVTPNNPYTGTITITPSGSGSTGLSAQVLTFTNSSAAQTFTLTPMVAGNITLTSTNSGTLVNPSNIDYIVNAVAPDAPASVSAIAGNTTAIVTFVAPVNNGGTSNLTYAVSSIPAGGTDINAGTASLTHTITGLTNGTSYTFTVKATNIAGTSVVSTPSNSVIPTAPVATAFTLTGPSSGNVNSASANFTVTPNNPYTGTITITPSGSGSTGLSAKVLTFMNSSAAQTFTITPTVAGSITLTSTNSGSLVNPSNIDYIVNAIAPDAPASVSAIAGNTTATITFVAPNNNGGTSNLSYAVSSVPAGGTDINAGTASLTHTITGLTNGTSYTFTVKATNIAGTSVASTPSNTVTPVALTTTEYKSICDGSSYNGWTITGKYERTLVLESGGENIVTTYLTVNPKYSVTEDITINSGENYNGWTASGQYIRTLSSVSGCDSIVTTNLTVVVNTEKQGQIPTHFVPVWQGQAGTNLMNFVINSAVFEDMSLKANDEIGVFSDSSCVGAGKLLNTINPADQSTYLSFQASQNTSTTNGYILNDTIIFKIWDNTNQIERSVQLVRYQSGVAPVITTGRFSSMAKVIVSLESYIEYTQTISLKQGNNLFSTYIVPTNPDLGKVVKPLTDQGKLYKIQDEAGLSFEYWGSYGGWVNKIGNIQKTEGYNINVTSDCTLNIVGRRVKLPLEIPLTKGWNFISFPQTEMIDAMTVVQSLISGNRLEKVQDEAGNSIEKLKKIGWVNNIGNFKPGKGYKIYVNMNTTLTIQQNYPKSATILAGANTTEYFTPQYEGNGISHMNINMIGLVESGLAEGDEIAAYDGEICVGALKITGEHLLTGNASLVSSYSTKEKIKDGFTNGNQVILYTWNKNTGEKTEVQAELLDGTLTFAQNASTLISLNKMTTGTNLLSDEVAIDVYPNPSRGNFTVRLNELPELGSKIEILDNTGRLIASRQISDQSEAFNLDNPTSGLYFVKTTFGTKSKIQKLIVNK